MTEKTIREQIEETAREKFGIESIKPFQLLIMQRIMEQEGSEIVRNQLVILPTGHGKSLCFLLPATLIKNITIIVYPLLALMNDQNSKLQKAGIDCVVLRGGQTKYERETIFNRLKNGTKIIITNPETLNQKRLLKQLISFSIELLVIDEAHVISQWGKDFRPAYSALSETAKILKPHQILGFTATASQDTVKDITDCIFSSRPLVIRGDADRENIRYNSYPAINKTEALAEILSFCKRPAIVFCNSRLSTYKYCVFFKRLFPVVPMMYYHAGLTRTEREKIEQRFLKSTDGILFATCAYGMGIDKSDIRTAIHSYLPVSIEEYLQESGRIGRDRQSSDAFVIITPEDKGKIADIFRNNKCRRIQLLETLGQEKSTCTGCDICNKTTMHEPYGYRLINRLIKTHPFRYTDRTAARLLSGNYCKFYTAKTRKTNTFLNTLKYDEDLLQETISKMNFGQLFFKHKALLYNKYSKLLTFIAKLWNKKNPYLP